MMPVDEHVALFKQMWRQVPFELIQPQIAPSNDPDEVEFVGRELGATI
jgi:hypothetical protein